MSRTTRSIRVSLPRRQEGVVLMVALIVLVAMTLAGIGIMRAVDTGTLVAGNIGFRQAAVASGDSGIEAARTWLIVNRDTLDTDQTGQGYYSTRRGFSPSPAGWGCCRPSRRRRCRPRSCCR